MRKLIEGTTLYTLQKLCLNCWSNNVGNANRCKHCGNLFMGEATSEEQAELIQILNEKRENREKNKSEFDYGID